MLDWLSWCRRFTPWARQTRFGCFSHRHSTIQLNCEWVHIGLTLWARERWPPPSFMIQQMLWKIWGPSPWLIVQDLSLWNKLYSTRQSCCITQVESRDPLILLFIQVTVYRVLDFCLQRYKNCLGWFSFLSHYCLHCLLHFTYIYTKFLWVILMYNSSKKNSLLSDWLLCDVTDKFSLVVIFQWIFFLILWPALFFQRWPVFAWPRHNKLFVQLFPFITAVISMLGRQRIISAVH